MICPLCNRRRGDDADVLAIPDNEDGGLCWSKYTGECVVDGKVLYADDVILGLRAECARLRAAIVTHREAARTADQVGYAIDRDLWAALGSTP